MIDRREILKFAGGAFLCLQLPAAEPGAPLFFTPDEFALLDKLTELIIPTDEHSPGAHAAGVAAYIDRTVAEAFVPDEKTSWRKGLAAVERLCKEHGAQPAAVLTKLAANEKDPQTEAEKFFTQLKQTTAFAYYSSSLGIHQEMGYLGNVLLQEFKGYDAN
jgi:gluconate 2-dehydrogenase subunit 3-like protein